MRAAIGAAALALLLVASLPILSQENPDADRFKPSPVAGPSWNSEDPQASYEEAMRREQATLDWLKPKEPLVPVTSWPGRIAFAWQAHESCGGLAPGICWVSSGVVAGDGTVAVTGGIGGGHEAPECPSLAAPFAEAERTLVGFRALDEDVAVRRLWTCQGWSVVGRLADSDWQRIRASLEAEKVEAFALGDVPHRVCFDCTTTTTLFWAQTCNECEPVFYPVWSSANQGGARDPAWPLMVRDEGGSWGGTALQDDDPRTAIDLQVRALAEWLQPLE